MINVHYTQANLELFSPADLESAMTGWLAELPESKRVQIERIRVFRAKLCSLLGLQLLKIAMHQSGYYDFSLSRVLFDKNRKPRCPGFPDFNISHSHDLIACAVAGQGKIGIDVEHMREIKMSLDRIMSPAEQRAVQADPRRFFHFWTQKEAVIKADGTGGVWSMEEVFLSGLAAAFRNRQWHLVPLSLPDDYTGYFATELPGQEYSVKNQAMTILLPTLGIEQE